MATPSGICTTALPTPAAKIIPPLPKALPVQLVDPLSSTKLSVV
jgi:hypothetical protein